MIEYEIYRISTSEESTYLDAITVPTNMDAVKAFIRNTVGGPFEYGRWSNIVEAYFLSKQTALLAIDSSLPEEYKTAAISKVFNILDEPFQKKQLKCVCGSNSTYGPNNSVHADWCDLARK